MKTSKQTIALALFLAMFTFILFIQVYNFPFIMLDDRSYITTNSHIKNGLTWEGITWAFTSTSRSNWHPLTWLSHMLDVTLFGIKPGPHHMSSLFIHSLTTALLFTTLRMMTGSMWKSFFVATLFGLHPLHVESVAWVAERKDVLSGFCFILILWTYYRFTTSRSSINYALVCIAFTLGLMAKPMLVSVPLILLLLDIWPLGRTKLSPPAHSSEWTPHSWRKLLLEKLPLMLLSIVSSVVTLVAQRETISSLDSLPLYFRVANALHSYVMYLFKAIWPESLALYYPYLDNIPWWKYSSAALILAIISVVVLFHINKRPFLAVGWFWFIIMLVPVIGLVQVGRQAMADRYMYLPIIGLFLAFAWSLPDTNTLKKWHKVSLVAVCTILCSVLAMTTLRQLAFWKNGVTLFQHSLDVTGDNYQARKGLAIELSNAGRNREAIPHFFSALRVNYEDSETHRNLAFAFEEIGKLDHTIFHLREAFRIDPSDSISYFALQYYLTKAK